MRTREIVATEAVARPFVANAAHAARPRARCDATLLLRPAAPRAGAGGIVGSADTQDVIPLLLAVPAQRFA